MRAIAECIGNWKKFLNINKVKGNVMKNKSPGLFAFAWSLIIDHLFAVLITILITTVINFFTSKASVLIFVLSMAVYFSICYVDSWQRGNSDTNRIRLGIMKKNNLRGACAGLLAAIPSFVLAIGAMLAELHFLSFYNFLGVDIFTALNRFWQLPLSYLYTVANSYPWINLLIPLFLPLAAEFGYIFGRHNISLKGYFLYKDVEK